MVGNTLWRVSHIQCPHDPIVPPVAALFYPYPCLSRPVCPCGSERLRLYTDLCLHLSLGFSDIDEMGGVICMLLRAALRLPELHGDVNVALVQV